jgi:hypothetical protein
MAFLHLYTFVILTNNIFNWNERSVLNIYLRNDYSKYKN